jgi:hypothetical protein
MMAKGRDERTKTHEKGTKLMPCGLKDDADVSCKSNFNTHRSINTDQYFNVRLFRDLILVYKTIFQNDSCLAKNCERRKQMLEMNKESAVATKQSMPKSQSYRPVGSKTNITPLLTHQQIEERAKAIWRQKGCPVGQDEKNWYEAETQLKKEFATK